MYSFFLCCSCLLLSACAGPAAVVAPAPVVTLQADELYIIPFEAIMVPGEVSAGLFDQFVDRLNLQGAQRGIEFIILKQGLAEIDADWLAQRSYLTGEIFAYIEEVGSTMTDIKARSRVRLYQPDQTEPALQLTFPVESFYQNDYSSLPEQRNKIVAEIATTLADQFLAAIAGR